MRRVGFTPGTPVFLRRIIFRGELLRSSVLSQRSISEVSSSSEALNDRGSKQHASSARLENKVPQKGLWDRLRIVIDSNLEQPERDDDEFAELGHPISTVNSERKSAKVINDSLASLNVESKDRALPTQSTRVKNHQTPVCSLRIPEQVTVRITNISSKTTEPAVHMICMQHGSVAGLARANESSVDVVFNLSNGMTVDNILKGLNSLSIDNSQWSAQALSFCAKNSSADTADAQYQEFQLGSQISNSIVKLKGHLQMQQIYLDDLENLHHAIAHLKECSNSYHQSNKTSSASA